MSKPWFGPKKYGIGIGPTSPEGWASIGVFAGVVIGLRAAAPVLHLPAWIATLGVCAALAGLLVLAAFKSDGALIRWRWGNKR